MGQMESNHSSSGGGGPSRGGPSPRGVEARTCTRSAPRARWARSRIASAASMPPKTTSPPSPTHPTTIPAFAQVSIDPPHLGSHFDSGGAHSPQMRPIQRPMTVSAATPQVPHPLTKSTRESRATRRRCWAPLAHEGEPIGSGEGRGCITKVSGIIQTGTAYTDNVVNKRATVVHLRNPRTQAGSVRGGADVTCHALLVRVGYGIAHHIFPRHLAMSTAMILNFAVREKAAKDARVAAASRANPSLSSRV
jgi:hypothetical protein